MDSAEARGASSWDPLPVGIVVHHDSSPSLADALFTVETEHEFSMHVHTHMRAHAHTHTDSSDYSPSPPPSQLLLSAVQPGPAQVSSCFRNFPVTLWHWFLELVPASCPGSWSNFVPVALVSGTNSCRWPCFLEPVPVSGRWFLEPVIVGGPSSWSQFLPVALVQGARSCQWPWFLERSA